MAINFERVCKSYRVYSSPQDRLKEWITRKCIHNIHYALSDISFSVQQGETFGLVGENGAGKSTLLKIAAGTIQPSRGLVSHTGRIAALLELGAGFHPDETGHENVRFMAALYGLEGESLRSFIEHAEKFSELSAESMSRPVKTYSSGMFMRLAFATATAIEPDILIVDEALSVGDIHFQKKSLNRILELRDRGATVLFCSHNLYQVRSLCQRAAWIHDGRIQSIGGTEEVVTAYEAHERRRYVHLVNSEAPHNAPESPATVVQTTSLLAKIKSVCIETSDGVNPSYIDAFQDVTLQIEAETYGDAPFHVLFAIVRPDKDNVFGSSTQFREGGKPLEGRGLHRVHVKFPRLPLLSGEYLWSIYLLDDSGLQVLDMAELIQPFTVLSQNNREFGVAWLNHAWVYLN